MQSLSQGLSRAIGAVVIGRNEGPRLMRCLESLKGQAGPIVYVDSGSTDGSVPMAQSQGIDVVNLDMSKPFTMARGRNAGFARLLSLTPAAEYVQFVDGDCEVAAGWITAAVRTISDRPDVSIVCGNRVERFPNASIFNRLADMEWKGRPGEVAATGGDVLVRVDAFRAVGGFNESMIAGEDPELGIRLRLAGWKLLRIDVPMTTHDMAMTRLSQWWKRSVRSGHAYAERAALHGHGPSHPCLRECRSNWFWGAILPASLLIATWSTGGLSLLGFLLYPMQVVRIAVGRRLNFREPWSQTILYGWHCLLGKFANACGQGWYWIRRFRGKGASLIEYKSPI